MATDATLAMRAVELKKGQSFAPLCKMVASHVYGRSILNSKLQENREMYVCIG